MTIFSKKDPFVNRSFYVVHPTFALPLGPGTLFLMSPEDDLHFTHEAAFEVILEEESIFDDPESPNIGDYEWREAWVWRHLGSFKAFHVSNGMHMHASADILEQEKKRKAKRSEKASKERRLASRIW